MNSLIVAKILKPQGIKGELKVASYTDSPEDLQAFDAVYVGGNRYKVLKVRPQAGDLAYISLAGIADRNAAEELRNEDVVVDRDEIPALPDGAHYIADVIGCEVVTREGEVLGVVSDIVPARTDVFEYVKPNGGKVVFAAADGVIADIDTAGKKVTVDKARLSEVAIDD